MKIMEYKFTKPRVYSTGKGKKFNSFLIMNIGLLVVGPILSVILEMTVEHESFDWLLFGKWFVFWTTGIRLFTAGISQCSNPAFTARIFKIRTSESYGVIRELGFANISLGVIGILSLINDQWRTLAAIAGSLFFGLAAIQHLIKKPASLNEMVAMIGDLFVLIILLLCLTLVIFKN
jgi:hypothetical protein